ncbi:MAG: hypothetical protein IPH82_23605 [Chloroflexi bacterium]|nr:hypothetical protein [Chloroflexota bacterium]
MKIIEMDDSRPFLSSSPLSAIIMAYHGVRILRDAFAGRRRRRNGISPKARPKGCKGFSGLDSAKMGISPLAQLLFFYTIAWLLNRIRLQRIADAVRDLKIQVTARLQETTPDDLLLFLTTLLQTADVANRFNGYLVLGYFVTCG